MRWSIPNWLLSRLRGNAPIDPAPAAVARWQRAYSQFNEIPATLPPDSAESLVVRRAVDAAVAEIWATERQMALHFGSGEGSVPVLWPWMRVPDELAVQPSRHLSDGAQVELPAERAVG
ncbi:MAG TPA: hypothetical protein VNM16_07715 [Bacillota bacterium]|nr:hypothetical protein [Bacillota bacterium]